MSLVPLTLNSGLGQPLSHLSCCPAGIWLVHFAPSLSPLQHMYILDVLESGLGKQKVGVCP